MREIKIRDLIKRKSGSYSIRGWIYRLRIVGGKAFVLIRDSTGVIQAVIDKQKFPDDRWSSIENAYIEASIMVKGSLRVDERAPNGVEIDVEDFNLVNSLEQFKITEYQSPELLLDLRHLWIRSRRLTDIMIIRSHVFRYAREFLDRRGFYEITPPIITTIGGETGANLFELDYFGRKAYLTESSQLYAEAMIFSLEKVYSFAPSFRAEKSRTIKHLAEFWHLEPEIAYYDNNKNMKLQERLVSYIAQSLVKNDEEILKELNVDVEGLKKVKPPFKRLSYDEAIIKLQEKGSPIRWGDDFGVNEERLLTEDEEKPIFVYNWPESIKAFYMPINPKDPRTVLCADMLAPKGHGEIIGGSERIWRYDELLERMRKKGLDPNRYQWYLDLRKYGSVPHAGFGMGIERVIKWLLNLDHIRDAIPFPRVINRVEP
ncbi:MAG: asparagine--tRNA ligase [Candidatus Micrarchaeota archaeon]|nr:MAG: asparagine--tRNA ligase [Candidatus Micrarchaeota archaeon]